MVQLHAIQELWDLFSVDDQFQDVDQQLVAEFNAHLCVCLSAAAASGIESVHSIDAARGSDSRTCCGYTD
jgi:hypothetical protein